MAHSIQVVGGNHQIFHDADLIALVTLLDHCLQHEPGKYLALSPVIAQWQRDLEAYGPGVIHLGLDSVVHAPDVRSELLRLFAALEERLADLGDTVPASLLNERCVAPGVELYDYPTSMLLAAISKLRELLQP